MKRRMSSYIMAVLLTAAMPSFTFALGPNTVDSAAIIDGQVMTSDLANLAVTTAKIANGAITDNKIIDGAVTTAKIVDGAVTNSKITGPISASKMEKPANVITVALSGGDFTTISAALASLPDTNTTSTVIKVMPGTYTENITMKSYVHLQGSGRDVTTLQAANSSNSVTELDNLGNVSITDLTISGGSYGIRNISSSPTIARNIITGNVQMGIYNSSSSPMITANIISGNGTSNETVNGGGIANDLNSSPMITGNIISGNGSNPSYPNTAYGYGIYCDNSSPTITGNTINNNNASGIRIDYNSSPTIISNAISGNERGIYDNDTVNTTVVSGNKITSNNFGVVTSSPDTITGNAISGNSNNGIYLQSNSTATISSNKITGSGVSDITNASGTPNISFNLYNTIQGTGAVGMYNVKSDGTPAPISNP